MPSTMMTLVRQRGCAPKTFNSVTRAVAIGLAGFATMVSPAAALVTGASSVLQHQLRQDSSIIEVRVRGGAAVRRTTVVGPRGGVATSRTVSYGAFVEMSAALGSTVSVQ